MMDEMKVNARAGQAPADRKTRRAVCVAALGALTLAACGGGGGDSAPAAPARTPEQEARMAFQLKLAANMIYLSPSQTDWSWTRWTATDLAGYFQAQTFTGCVNYTVNNPDNLLSVGDNTRLTETNCRFTFSAPGGSLTVDGTRTNQLTALSSRTQVAGTPWSFSMQRDRNYTTVLNFTQPDGLAMDETNKQTVWRYVNSSAMAADGSQVDTEVGTVTHTATSSRGASNFTANSTIRCRFSPTTTGDGDCSDVAGTLTGTIYGQTVHATLARTNATGAATYAITYAGGTITVKVNAIDPARNINSKYTATLPDGTTMDFTGEAVSWLSI